MPKSNKYPLDLGKTIESPLAGGPVDSPKGTPEKYYPSISLEWDEPYNLPESGTMTVAFKRTSETNSKRPDGKTSQRVELDLTSIKGVEADEPEADDNDEEETGEILDKAKNALEKKAKRKRLPADDNAEDEAGMSEVYDS
jgi:hypothetical protein